MLNFGGLEASPGASTFIIMVSNEIFCIFSKKLDLFLRIVNYTGSLLYLSYVHIADFKEKGV